jgi:hypothetical protein
MLGIEASLIRPPPPPAIEIAGAGVAQESADEVFVGPSYPPGGPSYPSGEVSAVAPDGQARNPEVFARA